MADNDLDKIIHLVQTTGKVEKITATEDFYDAGFSSINALQLLLELESTFDVTIPDDEFVAARTCAALEALVARLAQGTR